MEQKHSDLRINASLEDEYSQFGLNINLKYNLKERAE